MNVVVPFDPKEPKTRLENYLTTNERQDFARAMLDDVLIIIRSTGHDPTVLATTQLDIDAEVNVDDRSLNEAVNDMLRGTTLPVAIVMADLPLITTSDLHGLFEQSGDIILAPGLGGGTNAIVVHHPEFCVDYHGNSYRDHFKHTQEIGATVGEANLWRLAIDIDEPGDFVEILLHAKGCARDWLIEHGFTITDDEGRVSVERDR